MLVVNLCFQHLQLNLAKLISNMKTKCWWCRQLFQISVFKLKVLKQKLSEDVTIFLRINLLMYQKNGLKQKLINMMVSRLLKKLWIASCLIGLNKIRKNLKRSFLKLSSKYMCLNLTCKSGKPYLKVMLNK